MGEWLGLLSEEENHVWEGKSISRSTGNGQNNSSKRKKGKFMRKKAESPNLVLEVNI